MREMIYLMVFMVMSVSVSAAYPTGGNISNDLLAWWNFNNTGSLNNWANESVTISNTGANLTTDRHGVANEAYNFSNSDQDYMESAGTWEPDVNSPWSFCQWFRRTGTGSENTIGGWGSFNEANRMYYQVFFSATPTTLRDWINGVTTSGGTDASSSDSWYHHCTTWDGSRMISYVNSTYIEHNATYSSLDLSDAQSFYLGRTGRGDYGNFIIDEVKVFGRALSSSEIQCEYDGIYSNGTPCNRQFTKPVANNVSITPIPLNANRNVTAHCNFTDADFDIPIQNQSRFYVNGTEVLTARNQSILLSGNISLSANITFSCNYDDLYSLGNFINSSVVTVGDTVSPTLQGYSTNPSSATVGNIVLLDANISDISDVSSAIVEINQPSSGKRNFSMSLFSGQASNGLWRYTYTLFEAGIHDVVFYWSDGNGNSDRSTQSIFFTGVSAPTTIVGGGGGSTTVISGNFTPLLFFGTTTFSFTVFSTPSVQERALRFENRGTGELDNAKVEVIGDVSSYVTAQVCKTPTSECKSNGILIKDGEIGFLVMKGKFDKSLGNGKQGIVRIQEQGVQGKSFDIILSADRPPAYNVISKVSQSEPYFGLFGDNEFPALVIVYIGFISSLIASLVIAGRVV